PLEIYLADDTVSEIMVNAPSEVYVERAGRLERAQKGFSSPRAVLGAIERIDAPIGRHVDESSPFVDARLPDGSRVNEIIPQLAQDHWVQLESRPPDIEGEGAVTIRDLVRNALRMRPDRIVVGDCRGGEALDMLQAMNTGHDGSLTTLHSNSPRDALARLETMVLMSGLTLPVRAIREQVASAVNLI